MPVLLDYLDHRTSFKKAANRNKDVTMIYAYEKRKAIFNGVFFVLLNVSVPVKAGHQNIC